MRREAVLAAVVMVGLSGCSLPRSTGKVELVVRFGDVTYAAEVAARSACLAVAPALAEPLPTSTLRSSRVYGVRFDITHAPATQVSALENCLRSQPGVTGLAEESNGEDG